MPDQATLSSQAHLALKAGMGLDEFIELARREYLRELMEFHHGNRTRAAHTARVHRNTLMRQLDQSNVAPLYPRRKPVMAAKTASRVVAA